MVQCLAEKGWEVNVTPDGGFDSRVPVEQTDQYNADRAECQAKFGYSDGALTVTPEQAGAYYDKLVAAADCLRGLGYDISPAPSRQSYVETLVGGDLPDWAPYNELMEQTANVGDYQAAEAQCPQPTTW